MKNSSFIRTKLGKLNVMVKISYQVDQSVVDLGYN